MEKVKKIDIYIFIGFKKINQSMTKLALYYVDYVLNCIYIFKHISI